MVSQCMCQTCLVFQDYTQFLCYLSGIKMMPLMMLSCSRTLVILGAVNWETAKERKSTWLVTSRSGLEGICETHVLQSPLRAWCWRLSHFCRSRSWFSEELRPAVSGASGTLNSPVFSRAPHPSVDTRQTHQNKVELHNYKPFLRSEYFLASPVVLTWFL